MGPIQRQVLRVLRAADMEGVEGLTPKQIARVLTGVGKPTTYGNVVGALSGMNNYDDRRWVKRRRVFDYSRVAFRDYRGTHYAYETFFSITEKGIDRLGCQCPCLRRAA